MMALPHRGFTLLELLIAMAIAVILLVLAAPSYGVWIADGEIRNAAQSLAGGLRYAAAEAVKRNDQIQFVLDKTTKTGGWSVQLTDGTATVLQVDEFEGGAAKAVFASTPAASTTVTFTGLGQVAPANIDATLPFNTIDITSTYPGAKALRILVGGTYTGIKICDPVSYVWPDPKACPPLGG